MTGSSGVVSVLAAIDVGPVTDVIGIPLAAVVVGLLILIDVVGLEREGDGEGNGDDARSLPIPGFLTDRRRLVIAAAVAGIALVAVFAARIVWIAA